MSYLNCKPENNNTTWFHLHFTLVELLIVISIIMILSSILLPALSKARNHAKSSICKNNLKQVHLMETYYTNDCNDMVLPAWGWVQEVGGLMPWEDILIQLGYNETAMPADRDSTAAVASAGRMLYHCPCDNSSETVYSWYKINLSYGRNFRVTSNKVASAYGFLGDNATRTTQFRDPANVFMIGDNYGRTSKCSNQGAHAIDFITCSWNFSIGDNAGRAIGSSGENITGGVHGKAMNAYFADGHVDRILNRPPYYDLDTWN